jgi:hypothetical protein
LYACENGYEYIVLWYLEQGKINNEMLFKGIVLSKVSIFKILKKYLGENTIKLIPSVAKLFITEMFDKLVPFIKTDNNSANQKNIVLSRKYNYKIIQNFLNSENEIYFSKIFGILKNANSFKNYGKYNINSLDFTYFLRSYRPTILEFVKYNTNLRDIIFYKCHEYNTMKYELLLKEILKNLIEINYLSFDELNSEYYISNYIKQDMYKLYNKNK